MTQLKEISNKNRAPGWRDDDEALGETAWSDERTPWVFAFTVANRIIYLLVNEAEEFRRKTEYWG